MASPAITDIDLNAILDRLISLERQNDLLVSQFANLHSIKEKQDQLVQDLKNEVEACNDKIQVLEHICKTLGEEVNDLKLGNNVAQGQSLAILDQSETHDTVKEYSSLQSNSDYCELYDVKTDNLMAGASTLDFPVDEKQSIGAKQGLDDEGMQDNEMCLEQENQETSEDLFLASESQQSDEGISSVQLGEENKTSDGDEVPDALNEEQAKYNQECDSKAPDSSETEVPQAENNLEDPCGPMPGNAHAENEVENCSGLARLLDEHGPEILKGMDPSAILIHLGKYLSPDEMSRLDAIRESLERNSGLLDVLRKRLMGGSKKLFSIFLKVVAGLHPNLYRELTGKEPTDKEADECIAPFRESLERSILECGHQTDSQTDKRINLGSNFVMLNIVSDFTSDEGQIPDHYKSHLERTAESPTNIPIIDILREESTPAKIILTGRGGIGKTTSLQWLSRKWALGEWGQQFSLVFTISLRILTTCDLRINLVELLTMYGIYRANMMAEKHLSEHWLRNHSRKVLVEIDGLDEVRNIATRMKIAPDIKDISTRSHPLDLVVNIMRGSLLPEATLIAASRPFLGLKGLVEEPVIYEIRGLTQENINDYVANNYPERHLELLKALHNNPILMSVCAITFYCTVITNVLNDDPTLSTKDIDTYTRLQSFILQKYTCRKAENTTFGLETCLILPKLAHLASRGIFDVQSVEEITTLVFTERDLVKAKLTTEDLEKACRNSIVQATKIESKARILVEFFHLSVQELLATVHTIDVSEKNKAEFETTLKKISTDGAFNMALMYLFGLFYDKDNEWISNLLDVFDIPEESSTCRKLMDQLLKRMEKIARDSGDIEMRLQLCQLAHESQSPEIAKQVAGAVVKSGKVIANSHTMTAVDTKALLFTCEHDKSLKELAITNANVDDLSTQMISTFVKCNPNLTVLDLSHNELRIPGLISLGEMADGNSALKTLKLESTCMTDQTIGALLRGLKNNNGLTHLHLANNLLSDDAAIQIAKCSQLCQRLEVLQLSRNMISHVGAQALLQSIGGRKGQTDATKVKLMLDNNNIVEQSLQVAEYGGLVSCTSGLTVSLKRIHEAQKFKDAKNIFLNEMGLVDKDLDSIVPNLKGLVQLERLHLEQNKLTPQSIPWLDTIALTCPKLQCINLDNNALEEELVSEFQLLGNGGLRQMRSVEARAEKKAFSNQDSTKLYLAADPVADLIVLNSVLQEHGGLLEELCIDLTGCEYMEPEPSNITYLVSHILETDSVRHSLRHLELVGVQLVSDGDAGPLVYNIIKLGHLTTLKIVHSRIGRRELAVLGQSKSITNLLIDYDSPGRRGILWNYGMLMNAWNGHTDTEFLLKDFCSVLKRNVVLRHLTLSDLSMGDNLVQLAKILSMNAIPLETLHITKCTINDRGLSALAQAVISNDKLLSLILKDNEVKPKSTAALCKGIKNNDSITSLKLELHSCTEEDFEQLTAMLRKNVSIENLDISCDKLTGCCKMNSGFARSFGSVLANNKGTALSILDISGYVISTDGMLNLCGTLRWIETLKTLRMQSVQLSDAHMPYLIEYLKFPTSLEGLDLRGNKIVTSIEDFLAAIDENNRIMELGLPEMVEDRGAFQRMFNWPRNEKCLGIFRELLARKNIKEITDSS